VPALMVVMLAPSLPIVLGAMMLYPLIAASSTPVGAAAGLDVVRPRMRGFMTASMGFCIAVVGGGGGPLLIGALSDVFRHQHGDMSLRYSLLLVPIAQGVGGLCYWWASRSADRDVALARGQAV
ncbi:MAG: hypothetical protein ABW063_15870, partial [Caulobacter sp.]